MRSKSNVLNVIPKYDTILIHQALSTPPKYLLHTNRNDIISTAQPLSQKQLPKQIEIPFSIQSIPSPSPQLLTNPPGARATNQPTRLKAQSPFSTLKRVLHQIPLIKAIMRSARGKKTLPYLGAQVEM